MPPTDAAPDNPLGNLTDRELEVFDLIGRGLSTAAIAEQMAVSIKTVETYRSNIKTTLNLKDAIDLIRFATTWAERLKLTARQTDTDAGKSTSASRP